ncbi:MAG: adenosylcobinamide-GDP ribazoletransferase [Deltaproteobacteria bacterium]|nr:adenosylcobinamide-GDP ribazoletransferase [Deltaproteobacteria bacterium]
MKSLIAAIRFITVLSVGKYRVFEPKGMIPYFPIVGILLGGMVAAFDNVVGQMWSVPVVSLLDVIFLVFLTGAFHLDGLGDTADGLLSHRSKERALAIMKDSRVGVMGLVAIVCALSIKWAGIAGIEDHRSMLLVIIPAYARGGMIAGIRFLEYGRADSGIGRDFLGERLKFTAFAGLLIPVFLSLLMGMKALWLNGWFIVSTLAILRYYRKKMGCVTGDMLGAMVEFLESILFLISSTGRDSMI